MTTANKALTVWLDELEQRRFLIADHQAAVDDLNNARQVLNLLKINQFSAPVITVAGTNGKGSVVSTLEAIYLEAGYRVAALTSPHLLQFNERLRIAGKNVEDEVLCQAFFEIEQASEQLSVELSYYRFIHLALLFICCHAGLDVAILEIGLGGRFDTINLVDNDLAVITSIGIDHTAFLGETREAIAVEKAGIIRPGKIVVCGEDEPPRTLLNAVEERYCTAYYINTDFSCQKKNVDWSWRSDKKTYASLPLPKVYLNNAATAIMVITAMQDKLVVPDEALKQGLQKIKLKGRCEIISDSPTVLIDVAHNVTSTHLLIEQVQQLQYRRLRVVFAAMADKDIPGMLALMRPHAARWYFAAFDNERGWVPKNYECELRELNDVSVHDSVKEAYQAAMQQSMKEDLIVVFGSFQTVHEVLVLQKTEDNV